MNKSEKVYRQIRQNEGDHLADSKQVPGAKSGALLDSENKVNGAAIFVEVDTDDFREEGYNQRAKEERSEFYNYLLNMIGENIVKPLVSDMVIPWLQERAIPQAKKRAAALRDGVVDFLERNRETKASRILTASEEGDKRRPEPEERDRVEMTAEEYNRLAARAIGCAMFLADTTRELSAADIIDRPAITPHGVDAVELTRKAINITAEHPELLGSCDQRMLEESIFVCLNNPESQADTNCSSSNAQENG